MLNWQFTQYMIFTHHFKCWSTWYNFPHLTRGGPALPLYHLQTVNHNNQLKSQKRKCPNRWRTTERREREGKRVWKWHCGGKIAKFTSQLPSWLRTTTSPFLQWSYTPIHFAFLYNTVFRFFFLNPKLQGTFLRFTLLSSKCSFINFFYSPIKLILVPN